MWLKKFNIINLVAEGQRRKGKHLKAKKFFKNNLKKLLTREKQDDKLIKQSGNDGK